MTHRTYVSPYHTYLTIAFNMCLHQYNLPFMPFETCVPSSAYYLKYPKLAYELPVTVRVESFIGRFHWSSKWERDEGRGHRIQVITDA